MNRVRRRLGANALEFALVAPALVVMLGGILDYGWYFWREAVALNAVRESVRAGSLKQPDLLVEAAGSCADCTSVAHASALRALQSQGFDITSVDVHLERTPETGVPCSYSLVIDHAVEHPRLFPLVPGPDTIELRVASMAQNVPCS